jgi:release factor glutamine methyltransferase
MSAFPPSSSPSSSSPLPSSSLSSSSRSIIVTRLRTAGCVFAEDEAELLVATARTPAQLAAMVDQRVGGLPLEHVLGWAEFCGLRIAVDPGVFVPRRRTEFLVSQAVALARQAIALAGQSAVTADQSAVTAGQAAGQPAADQPVATDGQPAPSRTVVVDLCCGSGAVGAALVAALDEVELYAVEIDPAAVRCARRNLAGAGARVYEGDLFDPLPAALRGRVGVLATNVPYVPTGAMDLLPPEARLHEARVALDGGADGLDILRRVTAAAALWLAPGGALLFETSERQAPQAAGIVAGDGLIPRVVSSDELNATVVIGTRPAG